LDILWQIFGCFNSLGLRIFVSDNKAWSFVDVTRILMWDVPMLDFYYGKVTAVAPTAPKSSENDSG
jgi:hypothetical protein